MTYITKRKEKQNSFEQPFSSGDWWLMFYLCSQQMQPSEKNSARRRFSQLFRMRRKTLPQWSNSRYSWQYLLFGHFAVSTLCRKENSLVYMSTYSTSMLYCCVYLLLRVLCCTCSFIFLYWIIVFQFLEKKLWLRVKEINSFFIVLKPKILIDLFLHHCKYEINQYRFYCLNTRVFFIVIFYFFAQTVYNMKMVKTLYLVHHLPFTVSLASEYFVLSWYVGMSNNICRPIISARY